MSSTVTIIAPSSITVTIGKQFTLFVAVKENGTPKTDAELTAKMYDETGVIETVNGEHISDGIYKFNFTDTDTIYAHIVVETTDGQAQGHTQLTRIVSTANEEKIRKILTNRWKIENNQLTIYDDDGVTPLIMFNLKDKLGNPTEINVFERIPI